jgi:internalin A
MSDEQEKEVSSGEKTTILSSEEAKAIAASATGKLITEDRTGPLKRPSAGKHAAPSSKNETVSLSEHSRRAAEWIAKKTETVRAVAKPAPAAVSKRKIRKSTLYLAATAALIVLIVLIAVILRTSTDAREYRNYYSLAQDCYTEHDYDTALTYLRKAARVNDGDEVKNMMVECYYAEGNYTKALEVLRSMDTRDTAVSNRIQRIEAERLAKEAPASVVIAGKTYPLSSSSLVLDSIGITNEDVPEIARIYSLINLSLANNALSDISPLSALGGLTSLNLSGNRISDVTALSGLTALRVLYLDGNPITDFSPLQSLSGLTMLSIKGISISAEQRDALSRALPNCAIHSEASSAAPQITLGGATFQTDSEKLVLSDMGLSDISALSDCRKLTYLDLSSNAITDISPLTDIPALETLILSNNQISNIYPLMGLSSIRNLYLDGNRVTDITALAGLSDLRELVLADNPIASLSGIENLNYLECLDISGINAVNDLLEPLYSCYSLRLIRLNSNPQLTGNAVDALNQHLQNCSIERDSLSYVLEISGYSFYDTDTEIDLSDKELTDLTWIKNFRNPEKIDLSGNSISNLYVLQWMDVSAKIKELDLSSNKITDINGIVYLTGIEKLDLSYNAITAINPLKSLVTLKELRIIGTQLTNEQIIDLCNTLPNCSVIYTEEG